jgi:hypothetical protein
MEKYVITHRTGGYTISITTTILMYILTEVTGIITCRDTDMSQGLTTSLSQSRSQGQTTHQQRDQILSQIEAHLQIFQEVTEAEAEGDK